MKEIMSVETAKKLSEYCIYPCVGLVITGVFLIIFVNGWIGAIMFPPALGFFATWFCNPDKPWWNQND